MDGEQVKFWSVGRVSLQKSPTTSWVGEGGNEKLSSQQPEHWVSVSAALPRKTCQRPSACAISWAKVALPGLLNSARLIRTPPRLVSARGSQGKVDSPRKPVGAMLVTQMLRWPAGSVAYSSFIGKSSGSGKLRLERRMK